MLLKSLPISSAADDDEGQHFETALSSFASPF